MTEIFGLQNVKSYILTLGVLFGIIGLYYLISIFLLIVLGPSIFSTFFNPLIPIPFIGRPIIFGPIMSRTPFMPGLGGVNIWPFWGAFSLPSLIQLIIAIFIFLGFLIGIRVLNKLDRKSGFLYLLIFMGTLLIIATNLIKGWNTGVESTMHNYTWNELEDIITIWDFIRNYEKNQSSLSIHARTHPPGSVLIIYVLKTIFQSAGLVAICLCCISSFGSAYFFNAIFKRYFKEELAVYMSFLYLLLPAIQVYYLANIYSLVATLILGIIYFYFYSNKRISLTGCLICLFLVFFITFMSVFIISCLFFFEIINVRKEKRLKKSKIFTRGGIYDICVQFQKIIILSMGLIIIYCLVYLILGYNYVNSFLIASLSENPEGFTLISNPIKYVFTRIKDIMDILMFFGPILLVLFYKGYKQLNKELINQKELRQMKFLVSAAIIALLILFAAGAHDHGETARAAIYIYPFLLMPVAAYLKNIDITPMEKNILLIIVFFQTIIMQLFFWSIW